MPKPKLTDGVSADSYRRAWLAAKDELAQLKSSAERNADYATYAWDAMQDQMGTSKGYYRIGKAQNGQYWVRWKWTEGPYRDCYVIGGHDTALLAFLACQTAADQVEAGKRTPVPDKPAPKRRD
jgi:hypothetical protein